MVNLIGSGWSWLSHRGNMNSDRDLYVSVLFSSFPMEQDVAWALYDSACELLDAGGAEAKLHCGAVSGIIRGTSHVNLGGLCGPGFEADVSTPRFPDGKVRFFVTHQGVELHTANSPKPQRAQRMN